MYTNFWMSKELTVYRVGSRQTSLNKLICFHCRVICCVVETKYNTAWTCISIKKNLMILVRSGPKHFFQAPKKIFGYAKQYSFFKRQSILTLWLLVNFTLNLKLHFNVVTVFERILQSLKITPSWNALWIVDKKLRLTRLLKWRSGYHQVLLQLLHQFPQSPETLLWIPGLQHPNKKYVDWIFIPC